MVACKGGGDGATPPDAAPDAAKPERVKSTRRGLASSYGSQFAGRRTASGSPYNPAELSAAHLTLRFGTRIRVTRVDRLGRAVSAPVIVTVNDRGPYAPDRVIDLSEAAARRLGLWGTVGRVRLEVLE